jgi:hypothetical protein
MIAVFEARLALAQRRLFVLNTLVPLALVLPIALGAAPRAHAAVVFTTLFTFFGVFGQAIPLARDAERGLTARYFLAGMSPSSYFLQRVAAHTLIDLIQLAPALLVIAFAFAGGAAGALLGGLAAATVLALLAANAIGAVVAAVARSIAEAALFASITALFALHASAVFRTPAQGSVSAMVPGLSPLARLHQTLQAVAGSGRLPTTADWTGAVTGTVLVLGLMVALATLLAQQFQRVRAV